MAFLKNAWYCAGFSDQLNREMRAYTILNEPVVLYRKENGEPVALGNLCPHRFATLSEGTLKNDSIQCPYHGLEFGADGICNHNPHGDGRIPAKAKVKSYPLIENQGVVWIWMGEAEQADAKKIIDIGVLDGREGWSVIKGDLVIKAHYEMVTDNLLDLGHVPYLHTLLAPPEDSLPDDFKEEREVKHDGDTLWSMHWNYNCPVSPLFAMLWDDEPTNVGTLRAHMRWNAPSVLYLDTGMHAEATTEEEGVCMPSVHLLTPETENSTHYFWAAGRNRKLDDEALSEQLKAGFTHAFKNEDEPMIEACAKAMGTTDLMSLRPIWLSSDSAGVKARQQLEGLIQAESQ